MASDEVRYNKPQKRSISRVKFKPGIKTLTIYLNESIFLHKGDYIDISINGDLSYFGGRYTINSDLESSSITVSSNENFSYEIDEDVSGSLNTQYTYMTYEEAWAENGYIDSLPSFTVVPSSGDWEGTMAGSGGKVSAEPELESIGPDGTDTPYVVVNMQFPPPYNDYPDRTYEMPLEVYLDWSNNRSGSYYNIEIRGIWIPERYTGSA